MKAATDARLQMLVQQRLVGEIVNIVHLEKFQMNS
jgi:hypothetical protein